jgi:hypothetical protein
MEEDWIDAYWVLFDCLWALECAVIQRYVDLRRQSGVLGTNDFGADTDETLEQLYHTRTSFIISIFHVTGPMMPLPALLDSLALTLLDWNDDLDSFLSRQDSLLVRRSQSDLSREANASSNNVRLLGRQTPEPLTMVDMWLSNLHILSRPCWPLQGGFQSESLTMNNSVSGGRA